MHLPKLVLQLFLRRRIYSWAAVPTLWLWTMAWAFGAGCDLDAGQSYSALLAKESDCGYSTAFNYRLALQSMAHQDYERALFALERVVHQQPDHGGALLDMLRIHYLRKDRPRLERVLAYLEKNITPIPPSVGVLIEHYHTWLDQPGPAASALQAEMTLENGFNSNINQGSDHSVIALSAFGPGIGFELSPQDQPRESSFSGLGVEVSMLNEWQEWALQPWVLLKKRVYWRARDFDTRWLLGGMGFSRSVSRQDAIMVSAFGLDQQRDDGEKVQGWGGRFRWDHQFDDRTASSLGWERRFEYARLGPDSSIDLLMLEARHAADAWYGRARLVAGWDRAREPRAGGDRKDLALQARWQKNLNGLSVSLDLGLEKQWERHAFNELLFGTSKRNRFRKDLSLLLEYPLNTSQQVALKGSYFRSYSDLPLFDNRGWEVTLEWRYLWRNLH